MATSPAVTNTTGDIKVGFLTYDLQEFTADCLSRLAAELPFKIKAFPIFPRVAADHIAFPYRPSFLAGRYFVVRKPGSTPEGFMYSINWRAAWSCVRESDVVILFGIQGGTALVATLLAVLGRKRLISVNQTLPPEWERRRRWWVRWLKSWILRRCHVHVMQTPVSWQTLKLVYGIPEDLGVEAPFESGAGVFKELLAQVSESREELRRRFGWAPEACVFLFVGTLLRFKGVETIIEASSLLKRQNSGFRVVCIGPAATDVGEPSIEAYQNMTELKGAKEEVSFEGKLSLGELARAYLAADAFLLPTQKDCWPKVLTEAALARLPLVTTSACGAAGSLVVDGETGLVIPPQDSTALAGAMQRLFNADIRKNLGQNAKNICLKLCDHLKEEAGFRRAIETAIKERNR